MKYQIDQSIKIENTNKTTYVCLANSTVVTISLSAKDKKLLQQYFRTLGKPLIFKLFCFAYLCAQAIRHQKVGSVTIDPEYPGHERQIKSFILQSLRIKNVPEPVINFSQVGKRSRAHQEVNQAKKRRFSSLKGTSRDILRIYEKINKK